MSERIRIHVPALTRVEGEGALHLEIVGGRIEALSLDIFEPPRYFEKFLEGRSYTEVLDIVARICGICPVAYQMSAVQAIEAAFGIDPGPWVAAMRRVFYCGEWLQSHALHIHLLALPDFLGFESAIAMAAVHPEEVRRGLRLQGLGNALIRLFGGRSVHPVGACVGGFHHAPNLEEVAAMRDALRAALPEVENLVRWSATLPYPDDEQEFVCVSVRASEGYPLGPGRIVSSTGLDLDPSEYEAYFVEEHRPHSTALFSLLKGRPYLVGPLARLNLNLDRLPASTQALLDGLAIRFPSRNMFHSLVARAIEIHVAIVEAIRLLESYALPEACAVPVRPRAGVGFGATEAPRGLLWHRFEMDEEGLVRTAKIVPPTSQNQARIEEDLHRSLVALGLDAPEDRLRLRAETVIRNYDPCISCATHFLDLRVQRR